MFGYMWKATVRNVNRALKEVNAFEREGDYRPATARILKDLLADVPPHGLNEGVMLSRGYLFFAIKCSH